MTSLRGHRAATLLPGQCMRVHMAECVGVGMLCANNRYVSRQQSGLVRCGVCYCLVVRRKWASSVV